MTRTTQEPPHRAMLKFEIQQAAASGANVEYEGSR